MGTEFGNLLFACTERMVNHVSDISETHCSTSGSCHHCCLSPEGQLYLPCCLCVLHPQPGHLKQTFYISSQLPLLFLNTLPGSKLCSGFSIKNRTNPNSLISHISLFHLLSAWYLLMLIIISSFLMKLNCSLGLYIYGFFSAPAHESASLTRITLLWYPLLTLFSFLKFLNTVSLYLRLPWYPYITLRSLQFSYFSSTKNLEYKALVHHTLPILLILYVLVY